MLKIENVERHSIAERLKIKSGDILLNINGRDVVDILDYIYFDAQEELDIIVQRADKKKTFSLEKDAADSLGLSFGEMGEINATSCCNKCVFCFVDQLPKKMRHTLYFKDDDYRLSFISGNYVTLTNIGENEIRRIIEQKISPLYVSVHAVETKCRNKILGNENAEDIMFFLERFSSAGIEVHCQIVLVGGLNDGEILRDSTCRLFTLYPQVKSLAVVPVGLTRHRKELIPLKPLTQKQATEAIEFSEQFNRQHTETSDPQKSNFIFCSDEMYHIAGKSLPAYEYYGEFLQIENGVGLLRKFELEFLEALIESQHSDKYNVETKKDKIAVITGFSAVNFLRGLAKQFNQIHPDINIEIIPIRNDFFGQSVTVTGLVTGGDIIKTLKNYPNFDRIIIPKCMLREFGTVFLDNIDIETLRESIQSKVEVCAMNGAALLEKFLSN
jgi:putative radical SAM enzyme (TIGR03279 family)